MLLLEEERGEGRGLVVVVVLCEFVKLLGSRGRVKYAHNDHPFQCIQQTVALCIDETHACGSVCTEHRAGRRGYSSSGVCVCVCT